MATIIIDAACAFTVTVRQDGNPVELSGSVTALLTSTKGDILIPAFALSSATPGANWAAGVAAIALTAPQTAGLPLEPALLSIFGDFGIKRFQVEIESRSSLPRSALFVRDIAVDRLRADTLVMAANGAMPKDPVSDDYLWNKLRAAESEIAHELRVPLVPTAFFPATPSASEIAALPAGMTWAIDAGYDYNPGDFSFNDKWGFIKLRNKPLQSVSRVRFAYPGGERAQYDLPLDWLRMDKKHGQIQFVPSASSFAAPLNAFVMQAIGNGRTIPLAIQITYVAGLENAASHYPELLDLILKRTALKVIEDAFLPQSGSISADGLSQSVSQDIDKHHETIDRIINGSKGGNGGLMAAIHGVRLGVL